MGKNIVAVKNKAIRPLALNAGCQFKQAKQEIFIHYQK